MQTYQSTPDFYREYIEHGWLKDQAAKVHKYIKRWRNKAGKWVYEYKEAKEKNIKSTSAYEDHRGYPGSNRDKSKYIRNTARNDPYLDWNSFTKIGKIKKYSKDISSGIHAGRQRAIKRGHKIKGYSGNLSERGYSTSKSGQKGYTLTVDSWVSGIDRAERSRLRRENEEYKKRGNKGNLKDRGYAKSTDGQRGYTLTWDSVKEGRKRANLSRKISNNKEMIANRKNNRPRARKKTVASGSYSVSNKRRIISDNEAYFNALMAAQQYHQNPYEKPPKKAMTNDPRYKKKKKS